MIEVKILSCRTALLHFTNFSICLPKLFCNFAIHIAIQLKNLNFCPGNSALCLRNGCNKTPLIPFKTGSFSF